jgi:plasmid stability protein
MVVALRGGPTTARMEVSLDIGAANAIIPLALWRGAMASVLIRDLDPAVVDRLKDRAEQNGRSLQKELKAILEAAAAQATWAEARAAAERIRQMLRGGSSRTAPT